MSLGTFVRKWERTLTLTGAGIVFLTFMAREVVLERIRDTGSAIRSAQDKVELNYMLYNTYYLVLESWESKGLRYDLVPTKEQQDIDLRNIEAKYAKTLKDTIALRSLFEEIPYDRRIDDMLWNLQRDISKSYPDTLAIDEADPIKKKQRWGDAISHEGNLELSLSMVERELGDYVTKTSKRLKAEKAWCSWMSIGLFTIGWVIGLLGRVFKLDPLSAGE